MSTQKRIPNGITPSDVMALHDAWKRLQAADAEREAALIAVYHLSSEVGLINASHLVAAPDIGDRRGTG